MKPIRILIADDHTLLRHGLTLILRPQKDLSIVADARNGEEAVRLAKQHKPDVVIMDLAMPVMDGVEATRQIREAVPTTHVLILTSFGTSADIAHAIQSGASGALVKDASNEELLSAIRTIAAGGQAFSREIKTQLEKEPMPPELTKRQLEILTSIVNGQASDAIAAKLGISAYTVNQHIESIRKKLGAASRAEAVAIALRKHLLKI